MLVVVIEIVGKALGRLSDCVDVETVRTITHQTSHAGRTEGNIRIESVLDLLIRHLTKLFLNFFNEIRMIQPLLIFFSVIHYFFLPS